MKKKMFMVTFVTALSLCLGLTTATATKPNTDSHIYPELKLYFYGVEDTSGEDGLYDNGTAMLPKALIYADTAYVPLRYFSTMLGIQEVGWDSERLMIWVNGKKPQTNNISIDRSIETFESYVNIHQTLLHVEPTDISYYPGLRLFFSGVEDTSGTKGTILSGERAVPKALLYKNTTYVPLRYFAAQMNISNDEIRWDPIQLTITIGKNNHDASDS